MSAATAASLRHISFTSIVRRAAILQRRKIGSSPELSAGPYGGGANARRLSLPNAGDGQAAPYLAGGAFAMYPGHAASYTNSRSPCTNEERPPTEAAFTIKGCAGRACRACRPPRNTEISDLYMRPLQVSRYLRQFPSPCSPNCSLLRQAYLNSSHSFRLNDAWPGMPQPSAQAGLRRILGFYCLLFARAIKTPPTLAGAEHRNPPELFLSTRPMPTFNGAGP